MIYRGPWSSPTPSPPLSRQRDCSLLSWGGGGTKSYDGEKAWSSIKYSIFSDDMMITLRKGVQAFNILNINMRKCANVYILYRTASITSCTLPVHTVLGSQSNSDEGQTLWYSSIYVLYGDVLLLDSRDKMNGNAFRIKEMSHKNSTKIA